MRTKYLSCDQYRTSKNKQENGSYRICFSEKVFMQEWTDGNQLTTLVIFIVGFLFDFNNHVMLQNKTL